MLYFQLLEIQKHKYFLLQKVQDSLYNRNKQIVRKQNSFQKIKISMKSLIKTIPINCCCEEKFMNKDKSHNQINFELHRPSFKIIDIKNIRNNYHQKKRQEDASRIDKTIQSHVDNIYLNDGYANETNIMKMEAKRTSLLSSYCQGISKFREHTSMEISENHDMTKYQDENNKKPFKNKKIGLTCASNKRISFGGEQILSQGLQKFKSIQKFNFQSENQHNDHPVSLKFNQLPKYSHQDQSKVIFSSQLYNTQRSTARKQETPRCYFNKINQSNVKGFNQFSNSTTIQNSKYLSNHVQLSNTRNDQIQVHRFRTSCSFRDSFQMETRNTIDCSNKENNINVGNRTMTQCFIGKVQITKRPNIERICNNKSIQIPLIRNSESHINKAQDIILKRQILDLQQNLSQLQAEQQSLVSQINNEKYEFNIQYETLLIKKTICQQNEKSRLEEIHELKGMLILIKPIKIQNE